VTHLRDRTTRTGEPLAPSTIRSYKALLSGPLSTAVEIGYIACNPALKVKTPKEPPRRIKARSGTDIAALIEALPGPVSRMIAHLGVQTGCRWGELPELRGRDVLQNPDAADTDYLDAQRAVADVGINGRVSVDGSPISRFVVEDSTKGGTDRRIGLSPRDQRPATRLHP
jgi:integrase